MRTLINHSLYVLTKIRNCVNEEPALTLFKTMIYNYYHHGDICYNSCKKGQIKKLQTLQINALRCIFHSKKNLNTDELHKKANLTYSRIDKFLINLLCLTNIILSSSRFQKSKHPRFLSNSRLELVVPLFHKISLLWQFFCINDNKFLGLSPRVAEKYT